VAGRRAPRARSPLAHSQHFLKDRSLAAAIVRDARVCAGEVVVDLGAGSGRLTAELAWLAGRVIAVELDPHWAARLRGRWTNVDVVERDLADAPLPDEPFAVVANIPFDQTALVLRRLLDDPATPLTRAHLVVEWGVAVKRGLPWPSTVSGVVWGAFYDARVGRRLPRSCFAPAPGVDAGVLIFRRRAAPLVDPPLARAYARFVAAGFRRGPRSVAPASALARVAGTSTVARDLDAHQWAELFTGQCRPSTPQTRRSPKRR
jgi:23S rRNA (adenine-N6)-dimethyltransferase